MSFGLYRKLLSCLGVSAFVWLATPAAGWAQESCAPCAATFGMPCAVGCKTHCPPPFKYTYEGAPRIHWHCGCPHPICNPCDLPHWGFHETCWHPWPFPPLLAHCPSPPPAAYVTLHPNAPTRVGQPGARFQTPGVAPAPTFPGVNPMPPIGVYEEVVPQLPTPRQQR
jgi:hypothetical protein